jgi:FAD/FMN-containing dehydrogenase
MGRAALALHESIKRLLDPKGLLNPGKKLAR